MSTDPDAAPVSDDDGARGDPADEGTSPEDYDNREANPNSSGPEGLRGDLGVSSERTGPAGPDPRGTDTGIQGTGIQGTGSRGTARTHTDGEADTRPTDWDAVDVSGGDVADHETAGLAERPVTDDSGTWQGIDRTVGEPKPEGIEDEKLRRED